MNSAPAISIVVPTYGRVELVAELLASIRDAQNVYPGSSEIIVVDASPGAQASEMEALCGEYGACYLRHSPAVSAQRNAGAHQSRYGILLFVDSDCIATPALLVEHARMYEGGSVAGCQGRVEFTGRTTWVWDAVVATDVLGCFSPGPRTTVDWGPTANISFHRAAFTSVGGFDTTFPRRPGGEDVDVGLRISTTQGLIRYNADALVLHSRETWSTAGSIVRRFFAYGRADCYLFRKHPHRVLFDGPTPLVCFLFSALVVAAKVLVTGSFRSTLPLLLWAPVFLLSYSLWSLANRRRVSVSASILAVLFLAVIDLGRIYEGIRLAEPRVLSGKFVFYEGQLRSEWEEIVGSTLSSVLAFFVPYTVLMVLGFT